ncbi:hypothetical protein LSH36_229g03000 [Paralvinella palmiformis]|uniref:Uncharacterized protein n=1 Tax=Paralvinella palmiformis TaxID=53620 RepID=A0AAD9JN91_9ANNE|nr:hypothetical protein LSH36_229g03000 [Paralvinella palmiformis]
MFGNNTADGWLVYSEVLRLIDSTFVTILGDHFADKKATCTENSFKSATVRMLIPDNLRPVECPHHGRFLSSVPDLSNCWMELRSSCDVTYSLAITSSCHVKPETSCNIGVSQVLSHKMTFTFRAYPEPCTTVAPSPAFRGVKNIDQSQDDDPGGGYSLIKHPTISPTSSEFVHQTSNYKQFSSSAISVHYINHMVIESVILCHIIMLMR